MFTLRPDASLPCNELLKSVSDNTAILKGKLDTITKHKLRLIRIYKEALQEFTKYIGSLDQTEPLVRQFKNNRGRMKIYKTLEVVEDQTFYNKTHVEGQEILARIDEDKKSVVLEIDDVEEMFTMLRDDLDCMNNIADPLIKVNTIAAKSDIHEDEFLDLNDLVTWDTFRDELPILNHNICIVMEFTTWYPADHPKKPFIKEVVQKMFFYLYNDDKEKGHWFLDTVGKGNTPDFKVVDDKKRFMNIHESKAAFLTNQFRWLVDYLYREKSK